jgi:histidinol phosphatase-like enzyme
MSEGCGCKKPKPGMLTQAAAEQQVRLGECLIAGDAPAQVGARKALEAIQPYHAI